MPPYYSFGVMSSEAPGTQLVLKRFFFKNISLYSKGFQLCKTSCIDPSSVYPQCFWSRSKTSPWSLLEFFEENAAMLLCREAPGMFYGRQKNSTDFHQQMGQQIMNKFIFFGGFILWELYAGRTLLAKCKESRYRSISVRSDGNKAANLSNGSFPLIITLLRKHYDGV